MTAAAGADVSGAPQPSVVASLRRRWWLAGAGLAATLVVAVVLPRIDNRAYQARASLFLVDATAARSAVGGSDNPYLHGSAGLVTTAELLAGAVEADADERRSAGTDPSLLEVSVPRRPPGPLLHLAVTAAAPEDAAVGMALAVESARRRLEELQARGDVGVDRQVTLLEVEANEPRQPQSGRMRPTAGIVFLGALLTVWCTAAVDRRRLRTRSPARATDAVHPARELRAARP